MIIRLDQARRSRLKLRKLGNTEGSLFIKILPQKLLFLMKFSKPQKF